MYPEATDITFGVLMTYIPAPSPMVMPAAPLALFVRTVPSLKMHIAIEW